MAEAARELAFKVPFPPSVNCLYSGKDKRHKSPQYDKWCREAWQFIAAVRADLPGFQTIFEPVAGWYRHGRFYDKIRRDVANYEKAVSDLMVAEKLLKDDSLIAPIINDWADDIEPGYTEVVIVPRAKLQIVITL